MKNIIFTAAVTALIFSAALNYAFLTGKFSYSADETSYSRSEADYVSQLASK